jgi:hypothetical protein
MRKRPEINPLSVTRMPSKRQDLVVFNQQLTVAFWGG